MDGLGNVNYGAIWNLLEYKRVLIKLEYLVEFKTFDHANENARRP